MFITDEDYKVVIGESALKVVSQVSTKNRSNAEMERRRKSPDTCARNMTARPCSPQRVRAQPARGMYCCDIALYHMAASLPQKMGMEIRKERYERAVKWLEACRPGRLCRIYRSYWTRTAAGKRHVHLRVPEETTL